MKKLLLFIFTACTFFATADVSAQTTVYYRNCDAGAHASCVDGTDGGNPGTNPASPRRTLPDDNAYNQLAAGSFIRMCNGSAWVSGGSVAPPGFIAQNPNATRTAPITIEAVDCGDGATGRPIWQYSSGAGLAFNVGGFCLSSCPAPDHGGYVFRGFRVTKAGALNGEGQGEAVSLYGSSRYVLFENMEFDNWANAFNISTDQNIRNLTFRNNYIHDNAQNGIVGSATDLMIEGNYLLRNNSLPNSSDSFGLEHALYIGGATAQQRITIRNNILEDNSTRSATQQCESGNITFRGNVNQVTIEGNKITVPNALATCYGISIIAGYTSTDQECVRRAIIRGNTIVNVGGSGMALELIAGGTVENNRVIRTTTTGQGTAISIGDPNQGPDAINCPMGNLTVKNNSIYYAATSTGSAIAIAAGTGHKVFNNAVYATAGSGFTCFSHAALGNFSVWNNNWCYNTGGNWSGTYTTLANAQAAGFDVAGGNTNPLFLATPGSGNDWSLAVQSGSPLRSAGRNTEKPLRDILYCMRDTSPDVGAHEFGGTPCLTIRSPQTQILN